MNNIEKFIGVWVLDSSKNEYQTFNPPKSGQYTISVLDGNNLEFKMDWTDSKDKCFNANYSSLVDGGKQPYDNPDIADFIETKIISENIMQTSTYKNEKVTSIGIRELSKDNMTMIVSQESLLPSEKSVINKSVYYKKL